MECPLLIYKDGRFATAEPEPDWSANLPDDSDDWEAEYEKAGLKHPNVDQPKAAPLSSTRQSGCSHRAPTAEPAA